jgi:hypothetical protein
MVGWAVKKSFCNVCITILYSALLLKVAWTVAGTRRKKEDLFGLEYTTKTAKLSVKCISFSFSCYLYFGFSTGKFEDSDSVLYTAE